MKIAILGAGKMAQGVSYYLLDSAAVDEFVCYDNNKDNLLACEKYAGNKGRMVQLDVADFDKLVRKLDECHGIVNTLPYALLPETTRAAIIAGKSMVDLGGNDEVVAKQKAMHELAMAAKCTIAPACGLAPGIDSDLAFDAKNKLDACHTVKMFCGGLPQIPEGELRHALFFNEDGLYNEYAEFPQVIKDGKIQTLHYLLPQEDVGFGLNIFESALTHGAFSPDLNLWRNVQNVRYATLRWRGHFSVVREMIRTIPREKCIKQLKEKLAPAKEDMIIMVVEACGEFNGQRIKYHYSFCDTFDRATGLSAMQRCTAFPAAETLLQILTNRNWPHGVVYHEPFVNIPQMLDRVMTKYRIPICGNYI